MKILLDTADISKVKEYASLGIIDGVTTNPSIMSKFCKDGDSFWHFVKDLCNSAGNLDVSIEAVETEEKKILAEGEKILSISDNVILKLPITWSGIRACKYFADNGMKVNMTLCFSAYQAILAAKAGAYYVSPFIGRLDDIGESGLVLIEEIKTIYKNYRYSTQILAASVRSLEHIKQVAILGADATTISTTLFETMIKHDLTDKGLKKFLDDWHSQK